MVIGKKTKVDVKSFRTTFQAARIRIANSKNIVSSHCEVLLFILDLLIEAIDEGKLSEFAGMHLFSIEPNYKGVTVNVNFRLATRVKTFKDVQHSKELIEDLQRLATEWGLKTKQTGRQEIEKLEVFWRD